MVSESLKTQVKAVLERYASDLVTLDLLWQWAEYGFGDDEKAIRINLTRRHGLTPAQAAEAIKKCSEECVLLVQSYNIDTVRQAMRDVLAADLERKLRDHVTLKASRASLGAKCSIALINWATAQGTPSWEIESLFSDPGAIMLALLRATIGGLSGTSVPTFQEIRDELIECGVLNKSVSVSRKGNRSDRYHVSPMIPPFTLQELAPDQAAGSWETYLTALFDPPMLEQARVVEEIAVGSESGIPGVVSYWPSRPEIVPSRGIVGCAETYRDKSRYTVAAINPLVREHVLRRLVETKGQRSAGSADALARAMRSLRDELWPKGELTTLKDQPDRKIWRLDQIGVSRLFIYFGNWLSESDLRSLRECGAEPTQDSFLVVLTDQTLPSLKAVVASSLKMWARSPISVIVMADSTTTYHLQGELHPSVARILELLRGEGLEPPPRSIDVTLTVTPIAGLVGSEVAAKVQVCDDQSKPVNGAEVAISWGDAESTAVSDQEGACSASHIYNAAGTYMVSVRVSKDGYRPGKDEKQVTVLKKVEDEPQLPYKITFPPYDDGQSLVFGRGALSDKIALGFETGKPLTPESLVTWNIHSVDEPFICTFQQIGMGKSTLANSIMLQAAFQGIPVVVFDPKPDYLASLIPVSKTIDAFPDYRQPIMDRFRVLGQDVRGFNLSKPVEFEYDGRSMQLMWQIYSFNPEFRRLGCQPLKMPLVVLPPRSDPSFREMCDSAATSLAAVLHKQWQQKAYNTTLSEVFQRSREEHPEKDYLLPADLKRELENEANSTSSKKERTRIEALVTALQGYSTAQSWIYAQREGEVAKVDQLVQNPGYKDGDGKTVTITVLDLNRLAQQKGNPARMNYVSNVCGYLYNLATGRKSNRPAQFLVVMDEAANYIPDPTDQFNNTLTLIRQGRSLGVRVWLVAQAPGQIEIQARNQAFRFVLAQIPEHAIRPELTRWDPDKVWTEKLGRTGKGEALIIDSSTARGGGQLCRLFTTPQTIDLLSPDQILGLL